MVYLLLKVIEFIFVTCIVLVVTSVAVAVGVEAGMNNFFGKKKKEDVGTLSDKKTTGTSGDSKN